MAFEPKLVKVDEITTTCDNYSALEECVYNDVEGINMSTPQTDQQRDEEKYLRTQELKRQLLRCWERDIVESPELINNESFMGMYFTLKAEVMGLSIQALADSNALQERLLSDLDRAMVDHNPNMFEDRA